MRCDSTSNSTISNYHCFSRFSRESQRAGKFSTYEVCGEIGHTVLECQVSMSFFQESESEKIYMANYSKQSYNIHFNNVYDTNWNNHSNSPHWNNEFAPSQLDFEQVSYCQHALNYQQAPQKLNLEIILENFIKTTNERLERDKNKNTRVFN
jgi:hypothetical protein